MIDTDFYNISTYCHYLIATVSYNFMLNIRLDDALLEYYICK